VPIAIDRAAVRRHGVSICAVGVQSHLVQTDGSRRCRKKTPPNARITCA
jgi:hypothetical protein